MTEHTNETRLALVEQALSGLKEAVDRMASRMVTHADLAAMATKTQLEAIERRVHDLEQGSPRRLWGALTKVAAGCLSMYAAWDLLARLIRKG